MSSDFLADLLSVAQAARRLGRPYYAVHRLALRGALGATQVIADRCYVTREGVDAYAQRSKSAAPSGS